MDIQKLLIKIVKILEKLNIAYFITGGFAVSLWGRPRSTLDIDVVIRLREPKIKDLISSLRTLSKAGYIEEDTVREALHQGGEFNFVHPESGIKVDFWIAKKDAASQAEFKRKVAKGIDGHRVYFISPEDLILSKLRWYKESNSSRHLEDIESVLKNSPVDIEYIEKKAEFQSTARILEEISKKSSVK